MIKLKTEVKLLSILLVLLLACLWLAQGLSHRENSLKLWLSNNSSSPNQNASNISCDSTQPCACSLKHIHHQHIWSDYEARNYKGSFLIPSQKVCNSRQLRENFPYPKNPKTYWQEVYTYMTQVDNQNIPPIYENFQKIAEEHQLSYTELPALIMSYIQSIPYILVHPGSCEEYDQLGGFAVNYHRQGGACLPYQKYGLQTPLEFMYHQIGDCDTRVIFAYSILSYFGYDVIILGSPRHAMIGINIPGHGNFITYQGKKYYFWETTYANWVLGAIPPEYQYETWEIYLKSKHNF